MKHSIYGGLSVLMLFCALAVPNVHAETTTPTAQTTSTAAMLEKIKALITQIEDLKKQLATAKGEVRTILQSGITEGTSGEDIKKIQEVLATDPTIYPEARITGYYGPMTKEAIKRFQTRHELEVTGVVDEDTKKLLEEYLHEGFGETIPPGLLRAPGIMKKVELRAKEGCDNRGPGKGVLCKKLKMKYELEDEEEDDDEEDNTTASSTDDDEDDNEEATYKDSNKAIKDAVKAIADAAKEIRKSDVDTADAEASLAEARTKLAEARRAQQTRNYALAVERAEEAEKAADEAENMAKGEAEDEDEDDHEHDEDEDEDHDHDEDEDDD